MPRRSTYRITDRFIKTLPSPPKGYKIYYDGDLAGFGCRVHSSDSKAFVLNYLVDGRERRMVIGQFPTWSSSAAREQARALKRDINIGNDPLSQKQGKSDGAQAARMAPSLHGLFERYDLEHLPRKSPRSASDDRSMWRNEILPRIGDIKVADLSHDDVDALHRAIGETRPVRANRVIEVLRKALNLSIRWGWRTSNPASGVHKNTETKRDRFLSEAEIHRLRAAISREHNRVAADAIELLLLTGARKSEVLQCRWEEFSLEDGIWIKPSAHTKQRKEHRLPLSQDALGVLERQKSGIASEYVFPGKVEGKHIQDLRGAWRRICLDAGFVEVASAQSDAKVMQHSSTFEPTTNLRASLRIHDLRHTYASVLASSGFSLPIIGALLGHTQAQTTNRYAHLLDEPLREAVSKAADRISDRNQGGANDKASL